MLQLYELLEIGYQPTWLMKGYIRMFFWFPPSRGKCEWEELKSFVELFNIQFGTKYTLSSCLDQKDRTNPQPEILLEDKDQNPW